MAEKTPGRSLFVAGSIALLVFGALHSMAIYAAAVEPATTEEAYSQVIELQLREQTD